MFKFVIAFFALVALVAASPKPGVLSAAPLAATWSGVTPYAAAWNGLATPWAAGLATPWTAGLAAPLPAVPAWNGVVPAAALL